MLIEEAMPVGTAGLQIVIFEPDVSRRVTVHQILTVASSQAKLVNVHSFHAGRKILQDNPEALFVLAESSLPSGETRRGGTHRMIFYEPLLRPEELTTAVLDKIGTMDRETYTTRDKRLNLLVGQSEVIQRLREQIRELASQDVTVLCTGESGCGKNLVAKLLHECGPRRPYALRTISCPSIQEGVFGGEVFGSTRGAYTGSVRDRAGRIESARKGTVLFDEIAEIPFERQAMLLEFLESKTLTRLGDNDERQIDVRIIAATNKNLKQAMKAGRFREDLYWRLNQVNLHLPPLRDRPGDNLVLADHFLAELSRTGNRLLEFTTQTRKLIAKHAFPGNVRQLRDAVRMAALNCRAGENQLKPGHFPSLT